MAKDGAEAKISIQYWAWAAVAAWGLPELKLLPKTGEGKVSLKFSTKLRLTAQSGTNHSPSRDQSQSCCLQDPKSQTEKGRAKSKTEQGQNRHGSLSWSWSQSPVSGWGQACDPRRDQNQNCGSGWVLEQQPLPKLGLERWQRPKMAPDLYSQPEQRSELQSQPDGTGTKITT